MTVLLSSFTPNQLRRAADLKEKIDALNQELATILDAPGSVKPGGKMSAAGRARVSAAQKARWARISKAKSGKPVAKAPAKMRKMSAAGRKRISEAAKARWAKVKAAGKKSL